MINTVEDFLTLSKQLETSLQSLDPQFLDEHVDKLLDVKPELPLILLNVGHKFSPKFVNALSEDLYPAKFGKSGCDANPVFYRICASDSVYYHYLLHFILAEICGAPLFSPTRLGVLESHMKNMGFKAFKAFCIKTELRKLMFGALTDVFDSVDVDHFLKRVENSADESGMGRPLSPSPDFDKQEILELFNKTFSTPEFKSLFKTFGTEAPKLAFDSDEELDYACIDYDSDEELDYDSDD